MTFQDELKDIRPHDEHDIYIRECLKCAKTDYEYNIKESIRKAVKNNNISLNQNGKEVIVFSQINIIQQTFELHSHYNKVFEYYFICSDFELVSKYMQELINLSNKDKIQIKIAFQFKHKEKNIYYYPNSIINDMSIRTYEWKAGVLCRTIF